MRPTPARRAGVACATALALALAGCASAPGMPGRLLPADHGAAVRYVALGDSTAVGVGATSLLTSYVVRLQARLRAVYPEARVANLGVPGATSADVLADQLDRAVALAPHLVTVSVGPNDITSGVTADRYAANMDTLFRRLTGETHAVVVASLVPDLAVTPRFRGTPDEAEVAQTTTQFNEVLRRVAGRHDVVLVDVWTPSRAEVPARPDLVAADGYHPSDFGYARWAELLWEAIAPRMPPPAR